jgi:hypothetical protein
VQSTDRFTGDEMIMAGYFDFTEVQAVIDSHSMGPEEKSMPVATLWPISSMKKWKHS